MDDWYGRLARDLVSETPAGVLPDGVAAMEIAFGDARSVVAYALELARAHRLPVAGSVLGDDVWLRFGDGRLQLTLNRRKAQVEVEVMAPGPSLPKEREVVVRWDGPKRALVDAAGETTDLAAVAREAIDVLVADWRARPASEKRLSSAPPPDLDDEPTKA